jgi:hypothetical protein
MGNSSSKDHVCEHQGVKPRAKGSNPQLGEPKMLNKVAAIGLSLGLALSPLAALAQTGQSVAPAAPVASHSKSVSTGSHRTHRPQHLSMHKKPQHLSMHKKGAKGVALARLHGGAKPARQS